MIKIQKRSLISMIYHQFSFYLRMLMSN